jgi:hypothetical protein
MKGFDYSTKLRFEILHWGSFVYILKGLNTCGFTIESYGEIVFLWEKYICGLIVMKLHSNYP